MNRLEVLQNSFFDYLTKYYQLHPELKKAITFTLNTDPSKKNFGDISSNAPIILAKELTQTPHKLAQEIAHNFADTVVEKVEMAGPGFLNFFLTNDCFSLIAQDAFTRQNAFFKTSPAHPVKYSIEFVSANPTGPLHLGHGRGGIVGDVLSNILLFLGHQPTKEFYINDAGSQIEKLGLSLKIRCQQQLNIPAQLPEDAYHGSYLIDLAQICLQEFGSNILEQPTAVFAQFAKNHILHQIKQTLSDYGITFGVWFSETTLHESSAVQKAINVLTEKNLAYKQDNTIWFKSTLFGDDKDRVLQRANGLYTYIAADIAYLQNKFNRGFNKIIMILGQDHHSYATRLKATMQALGYDAHQLDIILYQLVTIKEDGQLLRMSKRAGTMVTLQNIIDTVGKDVARFFYLNRKVDAHLDFDLDLALKKTDENPVYYIQYAYVRCASILKKAAQEAELVNITLQDLSVLDEGEIIIIKKVLQLKELLLNIAHHYQTHLLTYYVLELAREFHSYYNKYKVVDLHNIATSRARLAMINIIYNTLGLCLDLLGLQKPEKM